MTQKRLPGSHSRVNPSDSKMRSGVTFESILIGHFGVRLPESFLSHFWVALLLSVPVESGARALLKHDPENGR